MYAKKMILDKIQLIWANSQDLLYYKEPNITYIIKISWSKFLVSIITTGIPILNKITIIPIYLGLILLEKYSRSEILIEEILIIINDNLIFGKRFNL